MTEFILLNASVAVSPGDTGTIEVEEVPPGSYICVVSDVDLWSSEVIAPGDYIGTLGWSGGDPIALSDVFSDSGNLWLNRASFEVTNADVNLDIPGINEITN